VLDQPTDFTGGVAVVTGAAAGIGAGIARHAAELGMRVVLADVDTAGIDALAARLREEGAEVHAEPTDVRDFEQVNRLADRVFAKWGEVRLLVNNAGVELHGNTWEFATDQWHRIVDVNLNGVFHGIRAFVPRLLTQPSRSHVVNLASVAALRVSPYTSGYAATKHAVLALTEALAQELGAVTDRVVVSVVCPGAVRTNIFSNADVADHDGVGERSRQAMAATLVDVGLEPLEAARIILSGAARGDLRIHTDPEVSRAFITQRAADLAFWD
jgi:NADP-dependent 3-hydroxy acid dehydrogenase YdfG